MLKIIQSFQINRCYTHSVMDRLHTWKIKSLMRSTSLIMTQIPKFADRLIKYSQDTGALENGMSCELETNLSRKSTSLRNAQWVIVPTQGLWQSSLMLDAKFWSWIGVGNHLSLDPCFSRADTPVQSSTPPPLLLVSRMRWSTHIPGFLLQRWLPYRWLTWPIKSRDFFLFKRKVGLV